jgi:two-component system, OmpR family, response regulator
MSLTDTILIVDDSTFIVEGLEAILKKSYRTIGVYSGQQCLEILSKENPSIIILDIMMEPMDGWETLARIKENPATRHIPVLMFTAKKISANEADEHRISIDDFISKPVTPKKLIEAIEKVLARKKANRISIELWRSAGIRQDRIEEYTSLATGLEVDMSLLQNMKVQLSLLAGDDDVKSRADLNNVIAAIETRIKEGFLHEETLSRELQDSITKDAEEKKRAMPVPFMNDSGKESLFDESDATSATHPERSDLLDTADLMTPSTSDVPLPEVNVYREVTVSEIPILAEVLLPESKLPDTGAIPESPLQGSLFEDRLPQEPLCQEFLWEEEEMKVPAEPHDETSGQDPVQSGFSFLKEIPEINPATRLIPPDIPTEYSANGGQVPPVGKVPSVAEPQQPLVNQLRPLPARTHENKPGASVAPLSRSIGSGTDTSLRISTHFDGISSESNGSAKKNPGAPAKDVGSLSGGFISRIISTIIGIFTRKGK